MRAFMTFTLCAALLLPAAGRAGQDVPPLPHAMPGEDPVDPYVPAAENAGATPFRGDAMARAFGGQAGIRELVERFVEGSYADPVIGEIFQGQDRVRLKRTLFEQFCYILNAGCSYSGRDMKSSHRDLGIEHADMNRLVERLQHEMRASGIPFAAQNRFLAKLAPMRGDVVER